MIKVSIIIPVKNREQELIRAITSVQNQTFKNWEALIIDDKSEIDIKKIIDEIKDARLNFFLNDKNISNANVCRNIGLSKASGQYIAMLDSDDEWLPDHLEKKISFLEKNNCDGIFGSYLIDDAVEKRNVISRSLKQGESMADYLLTGGRAATPTHFYKASCAKAIGWDEALTRHQDYDFSIRFSEIFSFLPCSEITCIVHWKKGSERVEHIPSQIRFMEKHRDKMSSLVYMKYYQNHYLSVCGRGDLSLKTKKYFKHESIRYISGVSFNDYVLIQTQGKPGTLNSILYKIPYIFRVLFG